MTPEESSQRLHNSVEQEIQRRFPTPPMDNGYVFDVTNIKFDEPAMSAAAQQTAYDHDHSMETRVLATITVTKEGTPVAKPFKDVVLGKIPAVTDRGTYIIGGNETIFMNQMSLRPGVYVHGIKSGGGSQRIEAETRTSRGQRFIVQLDTIKKTLLMNNLTMEFGKDGGNNINLLSLLKILGATEGEIHDAIGSDDLYQAIVRNTKGNNTPAKIFKATHISAFPGENEANERFKTFFTQHATFNDAAKDVNRVTIGNQSDSLDKDALLATVRKVIQEYRSAGSNPSPDDMRFKEIASGEESIGRGFGRGLDAWIKNVLSKYESGSKRNDIKPQDYINQGVTRITRSKLAETGDVINPLALFQAKQKITSMGPGGLDRRSATDSNRNLQDTGFAKIDPIETPQSDGLGLIQHLTKDAQVKDGRIFSTFYGVKKGIVDKSSSVTDIDPLKEYDQYVAFNDPRQLKEEDGKLMLSGKTAHVRYQGDFINVPAEKVTLIDKSPSSVLGYAAALIPFGAHNDGARMLMGANMQKQAMALYDLEAPLVQSKVDDSGKTIEQEVGEKAGYILKSPVNGTVKAITNKSIDIEQEGGQVHSVPKLNFFAVGKSGGYIHHRPVVKAGDHVSEGDLLADGWQTKNGQLALGKNALVAFMPYEGYNFEDGVAVRDGFANNMASEEIKPFEFEIPADHVAMSKEVKQRLRDLRVDPNLLKDLDEDGVVKPGTTIKPGTIFVGAVKKKDPDDFSETQRKMNRLFTLPEDQWDNESRIAEGYTKGEVLSVSKVPLSDGTTKVTVTTRSVKPMEVGDKLAGRHGNKATISAIIDDDKMPRTLDGVPIDVIYSPLAVPSRKNIGQLLEVNAGLVAQKKGMAVYKVDNFDPKARKKVREELKEIGVPGGKMELFDPVIGQNYEQKVTVGPMYIMKLKHTVESKITARNYGRVDRVLQSPKKVTGSIDGERTNPQGVGGMEFWSLTSGSAVENVHEMTTLKSDGAGDIEARKDIYNALRDGTKIPDPVTPESLKVLRERMRGIGVEMTPLKGTTPVTFDEKFSGLMLQPMSPETMKNLNTQPLTSAQGISANKKEIKSGGVYDKDIFGENGDQWGHVPLAEPLPNPLFLDRTGPRAYEAMLFHKGIKNSKIENVVKNGKFIVLDPKDTELKKYQLLEPDEVDKIREEGHDPEVDTGASALHTLLQSVDLKEAYADAERRLKHPNNLKERSDAENHIRVLSNALDQGLKPTDYLFHALPVLPSRYRPYTITGDMITEEGLSRLYSKFIHTEERYQKLLDDSKIPGFAHIKGGVNIKENMMPEIYSDQQKLRYKTLEHIIGIGDAFVDRSKGKKLLGIMHRISGKESGGHGFLRENMQSKMQDYSGRSVIVGDPNLDLDEVGLPEDLAAVTFEPLIIKELKRLRYNKTDIDRLLAERGKNRVFRESLVKVARENPVILNRQPTLHRHGMQGFFSKIRWNDDKRPNLAIGLNPLVTTAYNADFDGDTMPVHLPITKEAREEVIDKLMPSKNLLNPTDNRLIMELKHEMQLGIFHMTRDEQPKGTPKKFRELKDLRQSYETGKIGTFDAAEIGGKVATAGQHMFNLALPVAYQDYDKNKNITKDSLGDLLDRIIQDRSGKGGASHAVSALNQLRGMSFKVATRSGMSIGVDDFEPVLKEKENIMKQAEAKFKGAPGKEVSALRDVQLGVEQEKADYVQKELERIVGKTDLLPGSNPVKVMMQSGARGNAGQITAMAGIVGVGKSVTNERTRPVFSSHLEGLSPNEFWDLSYDSRKGIYDKSIATWQPGALTRQIWMSNKQTIISEKDCGDRQGIVINLNYDKDRVALRGRVLLEPVHMKEGNNIPVTGGPISVADYERAQTGATGDVRIRSPLSCKSTTGICQLCYGARAGDMQNILVPIGEPVGSIAAQAIGEPSQQAIMRTFHTGAGRSTTGSTFDRLKEILTAPQGGINPASKSVLAQEEGEITQVIRNHPENGNTIFVGERKYELGQKKIGQGIKEGAFVAKGDPLTLEKEFDESGRKFEIHTVRDPREVLKLQGIEAAKDYLRSSLNDALILGDMSGADRRHTEVVISNMTNLRTIKDPGTSPFIPGQEISWAQMEEFNRSVERNQRQNVELSYGARHSIVGSRSAITVNHPKTGKTIVERGQEITPEAWDQMYNAGRRQLSIYPKPITAHPIIQGVAVTDVKDDPNWFSNASHRDPNKAIKVGAGFGQVDRLDNPLTRQMSGLKGNFGSGFEEWRKNVDKEYGSQFVI